MTNVVIKSKKKRSRSFARHEFDAELQFLSSC